MRPAPPQSVSVVHPHVPVPVKQTGVGWTHLPASVAEHGVHDPASGPVS